MKSPCTGCCLYNYKKNHCNTCFRTLEEIGSWGRMSEQKKQEALKRASQRKGNPSTS